MSKGAAITTTEKGTAREPVELEIPVGQDDGWSDAKWFEEPLAPWEQQRKKIEKKKAKKRAKALERGVDESELERIWEQRLQSDGLSMGRGKVKRAVTLKAESTPTNLTRYRMGFDGQGRAVDDSTARGSGTWWEPGAFEKMGLAKPKSPRDLERGPGQDCPGWEEIEDHPHCCRYRASSDSLSLCPLLAGLGVACGGGCVCTPHSLDRDVEPIVSAVRFFSIHTCRPGCGCLGFESVTGDVVPEYVRPKAALYAKWEPRFSRRRGRGGK